LRSADLSVRLGQLNVVIGPSGAGKSSLVLETLLPALAGKRGGPFASLDVTGDLSVQAIDARPMGRSSRSTPATWSGVMDGLRKAFADAETSRALGLKAADFSFNGKSGRCATCEGLGIVRVGLHLLEDAVQVCGECEGQRYSPRVLEARLHGRTIADVLGMSAHEAESFAADAQLAEAITAPLVAMISLGVGYLKLGTPSTQLSSGEAQRVRLATILAKERRDPALFVFDEPDRGLDPVDVSRLEGAFRGLVARGHTVLAISHHRQLWRAADALIEVREGQVRDVTWKEVEPAPTALLDVKPPSTLDRITVAGASTHNLKGVTVHIPHGAITAVVGPSGSGKSSLAFDTIAAEAMHRYAETLPFQVRRFMQQLPRPDVDRIEGLTPVIALRQSKASDRAGQGASSTVGTQSGIGPLVRLLFSRAGVLDGEPTALTLSHFSPDRAVGACAACGGAGQQQRATEGRLVTDGGLSLAGGAFAGTKAGALLTESDGQYLATLRAAANHDLEGAWDELPEAVRRVAMEGTGDVRYAVEWSYRRGGRGGTYRFEGTWDGFLALAEAEAQRRGQTKTGQPWLDVLERATCAACGGVGLSAAARAVRLGPFGIADVLELPIDRLVAALDTALDGEREAAWRELRPELDESASALVTLGLGALRLGDPTSTLSASEMQRVRLASVLRLGLTGTTIVLDEPGAGLRENELAALIERLRELKRAGNTVLVVTHRHALMRAADGVVALGPGAGDEGGELVDPSSIVNAARGMDEADSDVPAAVVVATADLPQSGLVLVDGSRARVEALIKRVVDAGSRDDIVDARRPLGAKMPLTALGCMSDLQALFHKAAKAEGIDLPKAAFSSLSPKGRCPACGGSGVDRVALDFMADLDVPCSACEGARYRPEVLRVRWRGLSVAELLAAPVAGLADLAESKGLGRARLALMELGLGHLSLGRRTSTLSGGESQRLNLAVAFVDSSSSEAERLYLLDQPARGLSEAELSGLTAALDVRAAKGALFLASGVHRRALRGAARCAVDADL
ncbi:MAG: hypothetical protein AAGG01_08500, partial [Planctomycetota bacterium]